MSTGKENTLEEALREAVLALSSVREAVAPYAVTFTPRDRLRLRGVGMKRQGFIKSAFASAEEDGRFIPEQLGIEKFRKDVELSGLARSFFSICVQLHDYAKDFCMDASDTAYHDATLYYKTVLDAREHRVEGADTVFRVLAPFFKNMGVKEKVLTERKLMRDAKALLHGKIDGEISVINASPKAKGGRRKVIDVKGTEGGK